MRKLGLIFFLFYAGAVSAQTKIKGTISTKFDHQIVAGVSIVLKDKKEGQLITYTRTDNNGLYTLNFNSKADSVVLIISGFNLAQQSHTLANKTQEQNFTVSIQVTVLKEVKVKPPKIRQLNDTITYSVDGFKDANDRTIGDVLKKMPGITVKDDGSILYNNKPINKFYIENKDLLQGRYGIATNNLEAKDVASVEVLENHQPIKALKNREFSDDPALNLKLKDSAKGILTANAKLGAGFSPLLWDNELFSMFFNKNRQNMNTYKGNNTGNDPNMDLISYYQNANGKKNNTSLAIQSPSSPAISQKRYLFNRAQAFSVNNLWAGANSTQYIANISYLNDLQQQSSNSRSTYYLPGDSLLTIQERLTARQTVSQLNTSLQLNQDKDDYYLDNTFEFNGSFNHAEGIVNQQQDILQHLNNPAYAFSNSLKLIKNHNKLSFKLSSLNAYTRTPNVLEVEPVLYKDLFGVLTDPALMRQELNRSKFVSQTRISFGRSTEHWKQNYSAGFNAELQQLDSRLQAQSQSGYLSAAPDSLRNNLHWNSYQLFFNPDYAYVFQKFRANLSLPLNYNYLHTDDQFTAGDKTLSRVFFNPYISLNYELSLFIKLAATARYTQQLGDIDNAYTGYIMQSYRNLVRNDGRLPEQQNQTYNLTLSYAQPVYAIFGNLSAGYFSNRSNLLYSYDYQGILSLKRTYDIPTVNEGYSLSGKISKGIDVISGTVSLDALYTSSANTQLSQNELISFKNEVYMLRPSLLTKLGKLASITYSFQLTQSKNKILNDSRDFAPIRSSTQRSKLSLFPAKGLVLNLEHEYFYSNAAASGNRVMNFADAEVRYRYKNIEYGISYTNIFDAKQYVFANYSDISSYYSVYNLRPAQVLLTLRFKIK